jgi:hypothetical protein
MARFSSPLNHVTVAAPCPSDWDQMIGIERVRFCGQCNLNVYNLSAMTRAEAEGFIANNEGRLCVRFYRRADGSILTKNCPVGLRAIRRRVSRVAQAVSTAVLSFFAGLGVYSLTDARWRPHEHVMGDIPVTPTMMGRPPLRVQERVQRQLLEVEGQMELVPTPDPPARRK